SCQFLGKLDAKLLMLYTFENGINFPRRIRWCAVNNSTEWDPNIDFTAGVLDISEVEDAITGWSVAYNNGYVYRGGGITVMTPTGVAGRPFFVENFSVGPAGVGVYTPGSLASYGSTSIFRSKEDFYSFGGSTPNPIGGNAKRAILADCDAASSQVCSTMIGSLGPGLDFMSYWLAIPQNNDTTTSLWCYHIDSTTWINEQLNYGPVKVMANLITG
ncbi:MAG: hypothetical protein ACREGC_02855, partial [Minisyncoccia bacterium]